MVETSRKILQTRERFHKTHVHAHEAIIECKRWYGDGEPSLGPAFTAEKTKQRHAQVVNILLRAGDKASKAKDVKTANAYYDLADKLDSCKPRARCGSLACPMCARAFQKAKVSAQQALLADLTKSRSGKELVFVTIIPKSMTYYPGNFLAINVAKANRWLKDGLKRAGIDRVVLGSADLGWESRRGGKYLQLHWHLAMWTSHPKGLKKKLKRVFQAAKKKERPVDVTAAQNHGFLGYMNKATKLPDLLRRCRTHMAELLLVLDQTEPLELLILSKLRLSAQHGNIVIRRI